MFGRFENNRNLLPLKPGPVWNRWCWHAATQGWWWTDDAACDAKWAWLRSACRPFCHASYPSVSPHHSGTRPGPSLQLLPGPSGWKIPGREGGCFAMIIVTFWWTPFYRLFMDLTGEVFFWFWNKFVCWVVLCFTSCVIWKGNGHFR